jgi:hypothetical protein
MSLAVVRPFFRTEMKALGYKEHDDAFNVENIPNNILEKGFHLDTESVGGSTSQQLVHPFTYNLKVRAFKKCYKNTVECLDNADLIADEVYGAVLSPSSRYGVAIKDIVPDGYTPTIYDDSNDNILVVEFNFTIKLIECYT